MRLGIVFLCISCLWIGQVKWVLSEKLASGYMINLLQHVGGWNGTDPSVTPVPASNLQSTALYLTGSSRHLEVSQDILQQILHLLEDKEEFSILLAVKQQSQNVGTLFSLASKTHRYLELESSGRRDELRLHYTDVSGQRTVTEVFPYRIADNTWHQVALSLSSDHVHLLIDCSFTYERHLAAVMDTSFLHKVPSTSDVKLWLGQRDARNAHFKGALEYVKLVSSSQGYVEQCPYANVVCPTCSQYKSMERSMKSLYSMVEDLSQKLQTAESRLTALEACECMHSCVVDETHYRDGESWSKDHCTQCTCRGGEVSCEQTKCPTLTCKNPVMLEGHCCPTCLKSCYFNHNHYDHGEGFSPRPCRKCTCRDGKMACERSPRVCPKLDCPRNQQVQGECCPYCSGTNYCQEGNNCHPNATCLNLDTKFVCECKEGFVGDGLQCIDRDECALQGGHYGHHCNSATTFCINTPGSYQCECKPGYSRLDPYSCTEHNECDSGTHECSAYAECLNTEGSYMCRCLPGYRGTGHVCEPVCESGCKNGGVCVSPGLCQCRHGFTGHSCDIDINECEEGAGKCHPNSHCVNIPGSFYCQCNEGYHSNYPDNRLGALCRDINECAGWGRGHLCPTGTICQNTDGGFQCVCLDTERCDGACQAEGKLMEDGARWRPSDDACSVCTCQSGTVRCSPRSCDCSRRRDHDHECCPQCRHRPPHSQCRHQELPMIFENGEEWTYQCQTCQCLDGEIDCWSIECPKLSCQPTVQSEGDCCPRCLVEDACVYEEIVAHLGQPGPPGKGGDVAASSDLAEVDTSTCLFDGRVYTPQDEWRLDWDRCTTCKCKRGHICCNYDHNCGYQKRNGKKRANKHLKHQTNTDANMDMKQQMKNPELLEGSYEINIDDDPSTVIKDIELLEMINPEKQRPKKARQRPKLKGNKRRSNRRIVDGSRTFSSRKERKKWLRHIARRRKHNERLVRLLSLMQQKKGMNNKRLKEEGEVQDEEGRVQETQKVVEAGRQPRTVKSQSHMLRDHDNRDIEVELAAVAAASRVEEEEKMTDNNSAAADSDDNETSEEQDLDTGVVAIQRPPGDEEIETQTSGYGDVVYDEDDTR